MRLQSSLFLALLALSLHAQVIPLQHSQLRKRTPPPDALQHRGGRPQAKPVAVEVSSFKELGPMTGWASTGKALIWTTDNGQHWTDITPPNPHYNRLDDASGLVDVFFVNERTGWVLFCYSPSSGTDDWAFDISATQDAGQTWVTHPVVAPDLATGRLGGSGYISFSDSLNGWANLYIQSSSAFNLGVLLSTVDGGKTWSSVEGDPALSGPVLLQANGNGWLSHNGGEDLEATSDKGKTFHQVTLLPPADITIQAESSNTISGLPSFSDNLHGYEPVLFTTKDGAKSELVLFATVDGGNTWKPDRRLTGLGLSSLGTLNSTSLTDSSWIIPTASIGTPPELLIIPPGAVSAYPSTRRNDVRVSSFISSMQGWISSKSGLFSTSDGGNTWQNISPTFTLGSGLGSSYTGMPQSTFGSEPPVAPKVAMGEPSIPLN